MSGGTWGFPRRSGSRFGRTPLCVRANHVATRIGGTMNKSDLIEAMAEAGDISKSAAGRALDALTDAIAVALKNGESVSLIGFGTFSVKE
ncbi:MAG: HU family DNA-binding protein, partial [Chromatiaceae bacterium]